MPAKYPVDVGDDEGIVDAVNYLLSGPSGLGQFFKGFSSYAPAYLTSNFRPPFTNPTFVHYGAGVASEANIKVYPNAADLLVGMTVTGPGQTNVGIATGANITSFGDTVNGSTTVNLSAANTADVYFPLFFEPLYPSYTYVAPIALGTSSMPGDDYFKFEFATPQAQPPFVPGNIIRVTGVSDSYYDGSYSPVGVVECTTTYVIAYAAGYPVVADATGGTVELSLATIVNPDVPNTGLFVSTDCNGKVVVNGGTDRIFLSAQLNNLISYEVFDEAPADFVYYVSLNRYKGFITTDPTNPEYRFTFDDVLSQQVYTYTGLTGTGTLENIETIFTTVIDSPEPAYYWYILDVMFYVPSGNMQVTQSVLGQRSLSAQVVKA